MSLYQFSISVFSYASFIQAHWITAAKDALVTLALYLLVGILVRNSGWGRRFNARRLMFLCTLGFLWALGIEYHAVMVAHRWSYTSAMPLIPGFAVGVAPLLQMMIVPYISIWIIRKQLSEK